jgi:hypothetical protein
MNESIVQGLLKSSDVLFADVHIVEPNKTAQGNAYFSISVLFVTRGPTMPGKNGANCPSL